jgi:hypothetical protein
MLLAEVAVKSIGSLDCRPVERSKKWLLLQAGRILLYSAQLLLG